MRVIAGKARRLPLKTVTGSDTRPTTDRIKETLFNILQDDLYDIRFLDMFSGSGGIGIEALSRGAREAVFVEHSREAAKCIQENLAFTHLADAGHLMQCDVFAALSRLEGQPPFQIIFMDPPYMQELEKRVLEYFVDHRPSYVTGQTMIIVEAAKDMDYSYMSNLGYNIQRVKVYKTNMHIFLTMQEQEIL
jgi:16S rRNA (guanine(966)-N(2))-methyltransferase RsmD